MVNVPLIVVVSPIFSNPFPLFNPVHVPDHIGDGWAVPGGFGFLQDGSYQGVGILPLALVD